MIWDEPAPFPDDVLKLGYYLGPNKDISVRDDVLISNISFDNILISRLSQIWLQVHYVSWSRYLLQVNWQFGKW